MEKTIAWEVQGHRGARGLLPENTLPSFEIALDLGVTSIETDVHLTKDDVPVLFHDARLTAPLCSLRRGSTAPPVLTEPLVRSVTIAELRGYHIGGPAQPPTPLAKQFSRERAVDPLGIPTLMEFFDFVSAYTGPMGSAVGKTLAQQERARLLCFDLELKRVPFTPETIGDNFDGSTPALLERTIVSAIRQAGVLSRTRLRSFDHRSMAAIHLLEPALITGLLIFETAPAQIGKMLEEVHAGLYCPDFQFVDAEIVKQVHKAGKRILPYTVNKPAEWEHLLAWDVDGVTTDYPDQLLHWLANHGMSAL